jgi:hypothetical protein
LVLELWMEVGIGDLEKKTEEKEEEKAEGPGAGWLATAGRCGPGAGTASGLMMPRCA